MPKTEVTADEGSHEILVTTRFDAPPSRVFAVVTDPLLIPKWWSPPTHNGAVDAMDVRPGGVWRFVTIDDDGNEFAFRGVYHSVEPPNLLVYTFEFEGFPGHVWLETVRFDHDGKGGTEVTDQTVFQSVADRDLISGGDMQANAAATMERLWAVVKAAEA